MESHSFRMEIVGFHEISTPGIYLKLRYFMRCCLSFSKFSVSVPTLIVLEIFMEVITNVEQKSV